MKTKQLSLLLVIMLFVTSSFTTVNVVTMKKSEKVDFSLFKERIGKFKPSAADKNYTEGSCTLTAADTVSKLAGTLCFEMTGTCKSARDCQAIAGQTIGVTPSLAQIQTMANNHGQLMFTLNYIDAEDIPVSVSVAYNSLKTFYGYP